MKALHKLISLLLLTSWLLGISTVPVRGYGDSREIELALGKAVQEILDQHAISFLGLQFDWVTLTIDLGPEYSDLGLTEQENVFRELDLAVNNTLDLFGYADQRSFVYSLLVNGVSPVLMSEPIESGLGVLSIQGQKIVLSPGHGWYDVGDGSWRLQRGYWWSVVEDTLNPELVMLVNQKLQGTGADLRPVRELNKSAGNHPSGHPWWEMDASEYVKNLGAPWSVWNAGFNGTDRDIVARPEYANWISAKALVSIHNNGGGGCGTETWYDTSNGYQVQSQKLAQLIQDTLIQRLRSQWNMNWCNRGVKGANGSYGEIRRFNGAGVIVELGFMDTQSDNAALQNSQFREIAASAIRDALVEYFGGTSSGITVPSGFNQLQSDTGVSLYKKDYAGGQPDYVQLVDLSQGAAVMLLHGGIADSGTGQGSYGGNNPKFNRTTLETVWNNFSASTNGAFCITNGQFFAIQDPAPLAFSLKKDGQILSDGYGSTTEYQGQLSMLEMWSDHADIRPLSRDALYNSTAPNILAGLSENADKSMNSYVGRTFAGIDDTNGDGTFDRVLIFNSSYARQVDAASVLRNFGADKVIMFDGGGSTQLKCGANNYISSTRTIPQVIAIKKGGGSVSPAGSWHVEYFNSKDFSNRCYDGYENSTYIFKNWGTGSPAGSCNSDSFSARFTRTINFSGGNYSFHCQHDDGCRILIDGQEKLNAWWDSDFTGHDWGGTLSGTHEVRIEFYDAGGTARVEAWWSGTDFLPNGQSRDNNQWFGEYYGNQDLAGTPAIRRNEGTGALSYSWSDSLGYGFPADNFSVRWQRDVPFVPGRYRFHFKVDDGGRLWINNFLMLDQWKDQGATEYSVEVAFANGGTIPVKFEYYENGGGAVAQIWWETLEVYTSNDHSLSPVVLTLIPSVTSQVTTGMTQAADDPNLVLCNRAAGDASVWYKYVPIGNGTLNLDTFGSDYDTMIGVFRGAPGSLQEVTCNDDAPGTLQSAVTASVTGGTTYYIVISSYLSALAGLDVAEIKPALELSAQAGGTLKLNVTTFADARSDHKNWRYIEGFYARGITVGCSQNPLSYCADNPVTRAAMTVFMLKTRNGNTYSPPASTGIFTDLPFPGKEWMQPYVEDWFRQGITVGCSQTPRMYCPENTITRAAISVFILKLKYGNNYAPPASTGIFTDVPYLGKEWMQPYVEDAYNKGFTEACNLSPLQFCPEATVTRGDMAAFLSRAFAIVQKP